MYICLNIFLGIGEGGLHGNPAGGLHQGTVTLKNSNSEIHVVTRPKEYLPWGAECGKRSPTRDLLKL